MGVSVGYRGTPREKDITDIIASVSEKIGDDPMRSHRSNRGKREGGNARKQLIRSDSRKVYHGSPVYIPRPDTWHSNPPVDFGEGFYVTEYRDYARSMAMEKVKPDSVTGKVHYHMMQYEYDDDLAEDRLDVLHFDESDENWARFIIENRMEKYRGKEYDIIEGPSADAIIDIVVEEFSRQSENGHVDWPEIVGMFESDKAKDQILFHTPRSSRRDYLRMSKHWDIYERGPPEDL